MTNTLKVRTTEVTLFQGDDLDKIAAAREAIDAAQARESSQEKANQSRRLNAPDDETPMPVVDHVAVAVANYDKVVEACAKRGVKIRLHALPRKKYREMVLAHPVREGNDDDALYGFNAIEMADDLVPASVDLDFQGDFLDNLSDADFSLLYSAAIRLNQGQAPDPKVRMSSRLAPTGDAS